MRLAISHSTTYHYDTPVPYGLQELRLRPRDTSGQKVLSWQTSVQGGVREAVFEDQFANHVELVSLTPGATETTIVAAGEVETEDTSGVVARHLGFTPLWLYLRSTELTSAGDGVRSLAADLEANGDDLERLHLLSGRVLASVGYEHGRTDVQSTAEEALTAGHGVCQDHAHVFLAATRLLGFPARYVSGYLMMDDVADQDASHAWADVWLDGLGWVGFDVANGISPDERHVRVATGLDYRQAAPVSGVRFGSGGEVLRVTLQIQQ